MNELYILILTLPLMLGQGVANKFEIGFNISSGYEMVPQLDPKEWWGPEYLKGYHDISIRPFQIKFDEEMIKDLRYRLQNHRPFTPALQGAAFTYGFNSKEIENWLKHWAHDYPFKQRERFLNQFPMFKTNIQGLDIQFIWIRPQVPPGVEVIPLLMMHGWPGSIRELYEIIPLLTAYPNGKDFAVELIAPSLPGYGYSDSAVRPGLGAPEAAVIMRNLMHRVGYKQFYIQGGDFGGIIGSHMSTMYPKDVLGYHTNFAYAATPLALILQIMGSVNPPLVVDLALADRMYPLSSIFEFLLEETGYLHEQATKPDTVGIGLADSPAGLLTYILEKFSSATNRNFRNLTDGGLSKFDKDHLIDNLMMYWAPNSMTTAMRFYAETINKKWIELGLGEIPTPVPTWVIQAKYEIIYQSPLLLTTKYPNLINATALNFGGHFLAFELPKILSDDVLEALEGFRRWRAINKDQDFARTVQNTNDNLLAILQELLRQYNSNQTQQNSAVEWVTAYLQRINKFK